MSERIGAALIEEELRALSRHVKTTTEFTLFGGCNMSIQDLKATTKDIDVAVHGPQLQGLLADLADAGFTTLEDPWTIDLDGYIIVVRGNDMRLDLFPPGRIFDGPGFTDAMRARRRLWFTQGHLTVHLADLNTTFLFKAITGRWRKEPGRDLRDLERILARGAVDWDIVQSDWNAFQDRSHDVVQTATEALGYLKERGHYLRWTL